MKKWKEIEGEFYQLKLLIKLKSISTRVRNHFISESLLAKHFATIPGQTGNLSHTEILGI